MSVIILNKHEMSLIKNQFAIIAKRKWDGIIVECWHIVHSAIIKVVCDLAARPKPRMENEGNGWTEPASIMMNHSACSSNSTDESGTPYEFKQSDYFKIVAFCLAIVLSLVGNSLTIAVVYQNVNKRMRTASNYFVVSMAVGDILVTVVLMVGSVVSVAYASGSPFRGVVASIMCKLHHYIWFLSIGWSTLSLSAIAVDRFLLVFFPHRRMITLRIARLSIAAIIIIAALSSIPGLIVHTSIEYKGKTYCIWDISRLSLAPIYIVTLTSFAVFLPIMILIVLYSAICFKLWLRKTPGNPANTERMNRRIVIMLITMVAIFVCCWLPVATMHIACHTFPTRKVCCVLSTVDTSFALWFIALSNSAVNPYIYFIFNKNFRDGAMVIFRSCRLRNQRVAAVIEEDKNSVANWTLSSQGSDQEI